MTDTKGPKKTKLKKAILDTLREKNRKLETRANSTEVRIRQLENEHAKILRAQHAAEADAEALLDAVRALSSEVSSDTAFGRRVREEARKLLESRKIQPPHTLGASRNRKSKKKRS